jgi:hypothetical protein
VPDISDRSDSDEVKRARAKFVHIKRTERRLINRAIGQVCPNCGHQLASDIDWEYDVLKPGLQALEKRTVVIGELPTFKIEEDGDGTDDLGE